MNSTVKVGLLVVVIVACLGFVVFRLAGGKKGSSGPSVSGEKDLYCMECKKAYKAKLEDKDFMPLQMGGVNANPKHTCTTCNKQAGVAAVKCPNCGEMVPSPGMQAMMMSNAPGAAAKKPVCPKCNKPMAMSAGMGAASGAPAPAPAK